MKLVYALVQRTNSKHLPLVTLTMDKESHFAAAMGASLSSGPRTKVSLP